MVDRWVDVPTSKDDVFDSFLELYDALKAGKTSDMVRLRGRIERMWSSFSMDKKREYTDRLLSLGKLDDNVAAVIRTFGGVVTKFS